MDDGVNWTTVITAALGLAGTLGGALGGPWLALSKDRKLRRDELDRNARYLAIRVVCNLDPFVSQCCDVVNDEGEENLAGETHPGVDSPTISLPVDVDWKSIRPDLMYRVLSFPNEVEIAKQAVSFIANELSGPPDYSEFFEERIVQYGQLGLAALELAAKIRRAYEIPERDFGEWHPKDTLQRAIAKVNEARKQSRFQNADVLSGIAAGSAVREA